MRKAAAAICASAPLLVLLMMSLVQVGTETPAARATEPVSTHREAVSRAPAGQLPTALTDWLEQAAITYQSDVARKLSVPRHADASGDIAAPRWRAYAALRTAVAAAMGYVYYWMERAYVAAGEAPPPMFAEASSVALMADTTAREARAFVEARRKAEADWQAAVERADAAAEEEKRAAAERKSAAEERAIEAERKRAEARKEELRKLKEDLDRRIEEGLRKLEELEKLDKTRKTQATLKALQADVNRSAEEALKAVAERRRRLAAERKAAEEKRLADARAADAREAAEAEAARKAEAERVAAEQKRLAEAKAAEERRIAEVEAEEARKAAEAEQARKAEEERKAAEEKRLADAKAKEARKTAESDAARNAEAERKASEEKRLADARVADESRRSEDKAERTPKAPAAAEPAREAEAEKKAPEEKQPTESKAADSVPEERRRAEPPPAEDEPRIASEAKEHHEPSPRTGTQPTAPERPLVRTPRAERIADATPRVSSPRKKQVGAKHKRKAKAKVRTWRRHHAAKPRCPATKATRRSKQRRVHVVRRGETLSGIARRYLGNGAHYRKIQRANRKKIRNPHRIYPCQVLRLPLLKRR